MQNGRLERVWIYGDSLSTGTHGEGAYLEAFKREFHIKELHNFAVGSSGLSRVTPNGMLAVLDGQIRDRLWETLEKPDLIFIWHGSNDWYWGTPIGSFRDEEGDSFFASVKTALTILLSKFPDTPVVWTAPIFRLEMPDGGNRRQDAFFLENKAGHTMYDYEKALEEASRRYHFPLIDTGRLVNIHSRNEEMFLEDHVHPNRAGYDKIEKVLIKGIRESLCM